MISNLSAVLFSRLWGLWDGDLSPFLVKRCQKELELNRQQLDKLIFQRIKSILQYSEENSKYYSGLFQKIGFKSKNFKSFSDIRQLPKLTKKDLRYNLPEISTKKRKSWTTAFTGGTTSSPVKFYRNKKALWQKNAFTKAFDLWYGKKSGDSIAYLWGASQDIVPEQSLGMRLRNWTYGKNLMLPCGSLDHSILRTYSEKLEEFKPYFVQAYPSALYELCVFFKKNNIQLPSLKGATVTAEILFPDQRKVIEEALNIKIFNWYGSRELGKVATECEVHDGFHINEPSVYVEIEPDSSMKDGFGHLIITDLQNYATPFIRYETGDIAKFEHEPCHCGRILKRIGKIQGRATDMVTLPNNRKVRLTNTQNFDEICELQIIQKSYDKFVVFYVKGQEFNSRSLDNFKKSFQSTIGASAFMEFEEKKRIPRERSGKIRLLINEVGV